MTDWLVTAGLTVAIAAAGWPWVAVLLPSVPPAAARAALAYLAGTALVTLGLLLWNLPGLPLGRPAVAATLAGTGALGWAVARRTRPAPAPEPQPGALRPAVVPIAIALCALVYAVAQVAWLGPVTQVDFVKAWGLKALYAFAEGDLRFDGLTGPHLFYPLEVSNLNALVYLTLGHVNDEVVRLPAALTGVSLAGATWWLVRLALTPTFAAVAVALAVTTPVFATSMVNGLADLTVAAYLTVCVLAAWRWLEDGGADHAALSGFAAGAAGWTKLEGGVSALVVLAAVLAVRRAVRSPGVGRWLLWFAVFTVPWQVYQRLYEIPPNRAHFKRLFLDVAWIAEHVARTLTDVGVWGVFWPLCIVVVALTAPFWWARATGRHLAAVALPNVVLTLGAYVTHYRAGIAGSVEATADRLYVHVAPSIAAMAALGAALAWNEIAARRRSAPERPQRVEMREAGHHQAIAGRDHA
jgi:hypothetical protein